MRPPAKCYQDLEIWQKGHALVVQVYRTTASLPKNEEYGLKSQMRRAAVSIPANIAEGFRRRTAPDKARFVNIALCSLMELAYYYYLAPELGFLPKETLKAELAELSRMLDAAEYTMWKKAQEERGKT